MKTKASKRSTKVQAEELSAPNNTDRSKIARAVQETLTENVIKMAAANAAADVKAFLDAQARLDHAHQDRKTVMLDRAIKMYKAVPNAVVDPKEGTTAQHTAYLDAFDEAMRKARNEGDKASEYTRQAKRKFKLVMVAVQMGSAKGVPFKERIDKTSRATKVVHRDIPDVAAALGECTTLDTMISLAQRIRDTKYKSSRASRTGETGPSKIASATLLGRLSSLEHRLDPDGISKTLLFVRKEIEENLQASQRSAFGPMWKDFYAAVLEMLSHPEADEQGEQRKENATAAAKHAKKQATTKGNVRTMKRKAA